MANLRFIFIDQLSHSISSLSDCTPTDTIMLVEPKEEFTNINHHQKKIAFLIAAQRHFAEELQAKNYKIYYRKLDDPTPPLSYHKEIINAITALKPNKLVVTKPNDWRWQEMINNLAKALDLEVEVRPDERFLCPIPQFKSWAKGKQQLRMEYFYREMRKAHNILIDEHGKPCGGQWNYDKENRKPPAKGLHSPKRISHHKSEILIETLAIVKSRFSHHFGRLEPFHFAVTAAQAEMELDHFIEKLLPNFGDYQDAMMIGEAYLYHSLISSYLNAGLLLPLDACKKAEAAYHNGKASLNAVEGFIRQILGWREFIRGIYHLYMPSYSELNYFQARRPLPELYWGGPTKMRCMKEAVEHTIEHAYSHHIQRLMLTGNFAMLAGLDVKEVQKWYLGVYSDAFEWVEMPNTLGMALFGDGGLVGSKPYAASGKYISRMSNYCKNCSYDPEQMIGEKACPFNALYWDFLQRNRERLGGNHRLPFAYKSWDNFPSQKQSAIREQAKNLLERLSNNDL